MNRKHLCKFIFEIVLCLWSSATPQVACVKSLIYVVSSQNSGFGWVMEDGGENTGPRASNNILFVDQSAGGIAVSLWKFSKLYSYLCTPM